MRGLNARDGCASWFTMARTLEHDGFTVVNSVKCNEICNDKWYNQIIFQRNDIKTPQTVLIRHSEGALFAAEKLGNKYPMILKTSIGSQGVGVMWVESPKALVGIVQLLYREDKYVDIILQEYIKTDYDVRVIIVGGEIMGAMKRPIIDGDFRSNVSQGSEPEVHEITEMEAKESLRAAKSVDGDIVGVDFIPAKNREKDSPLFIEVNSTPGLMGIESTFADSQIDSKLYKKALKKEKGKFSITTEILKTYMNRDNWR
jgi:ribosomal protein S6--L-glutamate ligase